METNIEIFYSNGVFLVYNKDHAIGLRRRRIVGQLIGCSPKSAHQIVTSGLPYLISHYAASIVLENKLAIFKQMIAFKGSSLETNEAKFAQIFDKLKDKARSEFIEKRVDELRKRDIEISPERVGSFDARKTKFSISNLPVREYSSYDVVVMDDHEVKSSLKLHNEKMIIFRDLHLRGFYVSSGMKFGCDFLVYPGDPVLYHAQYAVRFAFSRNGRVDLSKLEHRECNALMRLCYAANKIPLLATILDDCFDTSYRVLYWTLKAREYLFPESDNTAFESVDLNLPGSADEDKTRPVDGDICTITPPNKILSRASMAMMAFPLMTIIPICCEESDASSRTKFMNGSNPRTTPLIILAPFTRTRS